MNVVYMIPNLCALASFSTIISRSNPTQCFLHCYEKP